MSLQAWGNPQTGMYCLRHAGKNLEVRRVPNIMKGDTKKQYQVIVDGVFTEMGWSTSDAKTKAIKIAERSRKREDITPYSERVNEREVKLVTSAQTRKDGELLETPSIDTAESAHEVSKSIEDASAILRNGITKALSEVSDEDAIDAIVALKAVVEGKDAEWDRPISKAGKAALSSVLNGVNPYPEPQAGEVSFVLSGLFSLDNMPTTDALTTIRAAVELLREHGSVRCRVTVPNTVDL